MAKEDRVVHVFPHSEEAFLIVRSRWNDLHKEPEDQGDGAAWAKYKAELRRALREWTVQFSGSRYLQHQAMFDEMFYDRDLPKEEGLRLLDDYLDDTGAYDQPGDYRVLRVAEFLLYHHWQPERVLDLLRDWRELMNEWDVRLLGDNLSAQSEEISRSNDLLERQHRAFGQLSGCLVRT
jgi:hypothetical protein